ncbi:histidine kinase-, DNA gyrase B-, and HSP90-like ATPase family protein [Wolffia australiana]
MAEVKREADCGRRPWEIPAAAALIDLSSSDEDEGGGDSDGGLSSVDRGEYEDRVKRMKSEAGTVHPLPLGFLDPIPMDLRRLPAVPQPLEMFPVAGGSLGNPRRICKQFWKAGDYVGSSVESSSQSGGMDHVRVHPKFLHSNATSHKWALGAIAELLDNALDEVCNGATFVSIDVLENKKDFTKMLLVEDNGGGMDPDKMRQCMSLGYSVKSKSANTIGQYGNGFKTSTMRLGADVIVFSRCGGGEGKSPSQSIGMLSYTFLRTTGQEDIVVPMLDYAVGEGKWKKMVRSSEADWTKNLETIVQWSPYASEDDLLHQFDPMGDRGTRIIIFNLWEDEQGLLELDFGTDPHDIQIRGVNRDEKKIEMAKRFPNSRHFLTYRHSLRSYASILYLRLPQGFRMFLRGKEIVHHSIVDDMMFKEEVTYKPQGTNEGIPRDIHLLAIVTIGFVKDAKDHVDVQGFNVYHKNRLIKPFWRVWNASGSGGRGVIGVLEANFVEPAHDKQDFERTTVLARLEARLVQMQKSYWGKNSFRVGYDPKKNNLSKTLALKGAPEVSSPSSGESGRWAKRRPLPLMEPVIGNHNPYLNEQCTPRNVDEREQMGFINLRQEDSEMGRGEPIPDFSSPSAASPRGTPNPMAIVKSEPGASEKDGGVSNGRGMAIVGCSVSELSIEVLRLQDRLKQSEDRERSLSIRLRETEKNLEKANKEQEALIDLFSEERIRRDREEDKLRKMLRDASTTIQDLLQKLAKSGR